MVARRAVRRGAGRCACAPDRRRAARHGGAFQPAGAGPEGSDRGPFVRSLRRPDAHQGRSRRLLRRDVILADAARLAGARGRSRPGRRGRGGTWRRRLRDHRSLARAAVARVARPAVSARRSIGAPRGDTRRGHVRHGDVGPLRCACRPARAGAPSSRRRIEGCAADGTGIARGADAAGCRAHLSEADGDGRLRAFSFAHHRARRGGVSMRYGR